MNESLVTSLDVSRKLIAAGIDFPESLFVWVNKCNTEWLLKRKHFGNWYFNSYTYNWIPAPLLSEITPTLIKLDPIHIHFYSNGSVKIHTTLLDRRLVIRNNDSAPDAAALMLIKIRGEGE